MTKAIEFSFPVEVTNSYITFTTAFTSTPDQYHLTVAKSGGHLYVYAKSISNVASASFGVFNIST